MISFLERWFDNLICIYWILDFLRNKLNFEFWRLNFMLSSLIIGIKWSFNFQLMESLMISVFSWQFDCKNWIFFINNCLHLFITSRFYKNKSCKISQPSSCFCFVFTKSWNLMLLLILIMLFQSSSWMPITSG